MLAGAGARRTLRLASANLVDRSVSKPLAERRRSLVRLLPESLVIASMLLMGCGGADRYVWYSQLPKSEWSAVTGEYVVGVGDMIDIRVYQQEEVSGSFKVRSDGRIALPLAGEIVVAGKHPSALAHELEGRLKPYIVVPRVTVNVTDSRPVVITTMGEITTKGVVSIEKPAPLVQALAQCGGLTEFGDESRIFVLRRYPSFQRIRFTLEAIINNVDGAAVFPLRTGDTLMVE
jgi:polysaccharide export outer membrane protein